jgi:hypothetical protein
MDLKAAFMSRLPKDAELGLWVPILWLAAHASWSAPR